MAAPTINYATKVITIPQSFLTFVSGVLWTLDTNAFRLALRDLEDDADGIAQPITHNHNTSVLLGGIQYARVIAILSPYTITFQETGTPYIVSLSGSNNNILERTNLGTVQLLSNNSAGLINVSEVQHGVFGGGVTVDAANGFAGTTYPIGTPIKPVNNIPDAKIIAAARGFKTIYVLGNLVLDTGDDVAGMLLIGQNALRTYIQANTGALTEGVEIREAAITGTFDGPVIFRQAYVFDAFYMTGFLFECQLAGTLVLGGSSLVPLTMMNCAATSGGMTINMGGAGHQANITGFTGDVTIANKTGTDICSIHVSTASVIIDATVTNGTGMHIDGLGEYVNNSSITPEHVSMLSPETIWTNPVEGSMTAEQMMRVIMAALAGKRSGLGTATEVYAGVDGVTPRITLTPTDAAGNGTPVTNGAA
jgi:hypothetical protein